MSPLFVHQLGILHELAFRYSRSSGPGGQNVNKVNSRVTLLFEVDSSSIAPGMKQRFRSQYANRISDAGEFQLSSDSFRDQTRNKEAVIERFSEMLEAVAKPPKRRKKSKPTRASKERRLTTKKVRSKTKSNRRYSGDD